MQKWTRKLKKQGTVPPGGWRFFHDTTNSLITAASSTQLKRKVADHCRANGIEPVQWEQIQDWICRNSPDGICKDSSYTKKPKKGKTLVERTMILASTERISAYIARQRATRCRACIHNKRIGGCWGCHNIRKYFRNVNNGRFKTLPNERKLYACQATSMYLPWQVFFQSELIKAHLLMELPETCWIRSENETTENSQ